MYIKHDTNITFKRYIITFITRPKQVSYYSYACQFSENFAFKSVDRNQCFEISLELFVSLFL